MSQDTLFQDMQALKGSTLFFDNARIPQIDAGTTFRDVYRQLDGRGAFFMVKDGEPRNFVRARLLANYVLERAHRSVPESPGIGADERDDRVRNNLAATCATPIEQVIADVCREAPVLAIHQIPTGLGPAPFALSNYEDRVFDVVEAGAHVGWVLNHESVRDATTDKTIFICTNPVDPHENIDPDHGICSRCPFPLTRTR